MASPEKTEAVSIFRDKYQKQPPVMPILSATMTILPPPLCANALLAGMAAVSVMPKLVQSLGMRGVMDHY
jgi:hypothetical protein